MRIKNLIKTSRIVLIGLICFFHINQTVYAQEKGPLMMNVEMGFTLGGMVAGAGTGFVIWFTDPLGPTPLPEALRVGAVIGVMLGAFAGFFVLQQAVVYPPGQGPDTQLLNELLGQEPHTFKNNSLTAQKELKLNIPVFQYKF